MKKNVFLIVNPISGAVDKLQIIDTTADFASKKNLNLILYKTSGDDDISKIQTLYDKYKPERIIVAGGDGTIKMVAEAMEYHDVILGILPAGTANGLAVELNISTMLEESLEICFGDNFLELDIIVINGKKCFHLSDLGINAELIKNYSENDSHGKWAYFSEAVNTLIDLDEPFSATITANNEIIKCQARMIVVANAKKYGTGVVINPDGLMNDGKFELVIIKNLDLVVLGKIISGNMPIDSGEIEIIATNKATIKTDFPVSFQIDGEYCGAQTELDIKISPMKIKIAIP